MCFSLAQSAIFAGVGVLTAAWLYTCGRPRKYVVLPAFLALMEVNQLLTLLGLVHIAFQPLVINYFLFTRPYPVALGKLTPPLTYPAVTMIVMPFSQAAAVLLLIKLIPAFVALLGAQQLLQAALAPHLPARVLSVLLTNTCADFEMMCGAKLCSAAGKYHLAWIAPQMGTGYYVPSIFLHFFAMFGPSILFGSTYHRLLMVLVLVTGPLMSEYLVWGGGQAVRLLEWPSIWCLFSVAQMLGVLVIELVSNGIVNKRWVLPGADAAEQAADEPYQNGHANGSHHAAYEPKKKQ
uniref:Uncharacterized protein n=1 Tax=Tetradesmus obliquus TaxID=3088 RepID=A0A383VV54_TETOB